MEDKRQLAGIADLPFPDYDFLTENHNEFFGTIELIKNGIRNMSLGEDVQNFTINISDKFSAHGRHFECLILIGNDTGGWKMRGYSDSSEHGAVIEAALNLCRFLNI